MTASKHYQSQSIHENPDIVPRQMSIAEQHQINDSSQTDMINSNIDLLDEERRQMKELQTKLDSVPDVYEDNTHELFEHSNRSSHSNVQQRRRHQLQDTGMQTLDGHIVDEKGSKEKFVDMKAAELRRQMNEIYQ